MKNTKLEFVVIFCLISVLVFVAFNIVAVSTMGEEYEERQKSDPTGSIERERSDDIKEDIYAEVSIDITDPDEGAFLNDSDVTVEWTSENADDHETRLDEDGWMDTETDTYHTFEDLEDGEHLVEVKAVNETEGNQTDSVNFTVDTNPPEIEITYPGEDDIFDTDEITVEWTGNDDISGIDHYEIKINEEEWDDKGTETNHTFSGLEDGEHTVEVRAWDNAGNNNTDIVNFIVDTTPPEIEITTPNEDEMLSESNVTVEWTGNDDISGIDHYEVRLEGESWTNVDTDTNYTFDLEDGDHTVEVRAWDNAGNNNTDIVNFIVDTTPPEIEITTPDEDEMLSESNVTVEWTGNDDISGIDHYEVRLDGENWTHVGDDTNYTFDLEDGNHTVEVRAWDNAGNNNTDIVNFTVETTIPEIEITAPEEGEAFDVDEVTVQWTGSDENSGIDHYEIRINENDWIDKGTKTNHTFSDLDDGDRTVEVRAWDNAGNNNTDIVNFTVDTTPPEIEITTPDEDEMLSESNVTVEWIGNDNISGIDHFEVRLVGENWTYVGDDTNYTFESLEDGNHTVEVRAWDNVGNNNTDIVNFTVDTTIPEIEITAPNESEAFDVDEVMVEWTGSDDISGIDHYEIRINQDDWIDKGADSKHTFYDLDDGEHTVEVRAWDNAGNSNTDIVNFIVDTTPPEIKITHPNEGEAFDVDEITVKWTGNDNISGIEYYEVRINEEGWIDKGADTNHTFSGLEDRNHTVEVRAWDNAGNNNTDIVNFTVDTTLPEIDITEPEENEILSESNVTVEWTGNDNISGIDHYEVRLEGENWTHVIDDTNYTFDLEDGEHTVDVRAWDNAGNNNTDNVSFTVDTVPPEIDITEPEENEILSESNVTVKWTGNDNISGIDHYEVRLDGENWTHVGDDTNYTFDLEDGNHTVEIRAWDNAGNNNTDSVSFTVDTVPPEINITYPEEGEMLMDDSITVTWTGSDELSGIDHYEIRLDGGSWTDPEATEYTFINLEDGDYHVEVRAIDNAGNSATDIKNFTIDTVPPEVDITEPQEDDIFTESNITVEWTGDDDNTGIDYYQIKIDGEDWIGVGDNTSYTFVEVEDGNRTVEVRAWDNAGNNNVSMVNFTVDATPPEIEIITPEEEEIVEGDEVTVEWTGEDNISGIDYYEIRLNEDVWIDKGTDTNHSFTDLEEGEHLVDIRAWDKAGNNNIESVNFTVDNTSPDIEIIFPEEDEVLSDSDVTVEWLGSDEISGIDHYEIRLDGGNWTAVGTSTNHTFLEVEDGNHTVEVRAWDNAGNNNTDIVNFTLDATPPEIDITEPEDGTAVDHDEVTVAWTGSDETTGIDHYEIRLDEENWIDVGTDTNYTFDLEDGNHTVEVRAWDNAGNNATDLVEFIVDTVPPEVDITEPEDGEVFEIDSVTVKWSGSDEISGIDHYEIRLDGEDWVDVGTDTSYPYEALEEGEHTAEVRVWDNAGNEATAEVNFTVDLPPSVVITYPEEDETHRTSDLTIEWEGYYNVTDLEFYEFRKDGGSWINVGDSTSHTYDEIEDGEYFVEVRITDTDSRRDTDEVNFTVDTTSLYVEITSPDCGDVFSDTEVLVEWFSNNATHHEIRINGENWTDVGENLSHTFSDLDDGSHTVEVKAVNSTEEYIDSVDFTVDTTPPDVEIDEPSENELFSTSNVTVKWTGSDQISGIDHYEIRLNGENWTDVGDGTEYTLMGLEDGEHTVEVRAWDNAGNNNTDTVTFTVDTTPPEIEIITPEEDEIFDVDEVMVEWTGSDDISGIDHYDIRINQDDWIDKGNDTQHIFYDLDDGEHTVDVRAWDNAGNNNTDMVTFTVDTTPPEIEIITPEEEDIFDTDEITIEWIGYDEISGIDYYQIRINQDDWIDKGNDTQHIFYDLDDGERTVEVRAWDHAGNNNTDIVTFTVDTTPPDINITTPEEDDIFDVDEVTVKWTGSDDITGIDHYEIRINDEEWIDKGADTKHTFSDLDDGERTVEVRAWDNAGNNNTDTVTFIVDTTPPEIEITTPEEGGAINTDEITVQWIGIDDISGIDHYEVRINEGNWTDVGDDTEHTFSNLTEGNYTVEVLAWNNAGYNNTDTVNFTVDKTHPEIEIITPEEDEVFTEADITVEWTGSDNNSGISHYEIRINQDEWIDKVNDTQHIFYDLDDGEHTVDVRAWDHAGNNEIDSVNFTVDTTPPEIEITTPEEGEALDVDEVTVQWTGSDDISGIDHYEIRINQDEWIDKGTDTEHIFSDLDDGEHTVEVRAWDNVGHNNTDIVNFIVDTTPPDIEITTPENDEIFDFDEVMVEWTGSDDISGIDHYEIRINQDDWIDKGTDTEHIFSDLDDGEHTVEVRVWDNAGNEDIDSVNFIVDTTPPEIEIITPEEDEIFDVDEVMVEWTGSDDISGIDHYEIRINDEEWIDKGNDTQHIFSDLYEGEHTVEVRAWDHVGHNDTQEVSFTVDTTPPEIEITTPLDDEIFDVDEVMVEWTGSDDISGIDHYEIRINENDWIEISRDTQQYTFPDLEDGEHTVEVRAWDHAGNNEIDSVSFIVDTTPPEIEITAPEDHEIFDVDEVTTQWIGSDDISGIDHYEIRINQNDWIDKGTDTQHIFSDLDDGEHTVEVRAWDHAGNNEMDSVNFIVDTTSPEIDIDEPGENEILSESDVTVKWTGNDTFSGIDHYEVRLDGENWTHVGDDTNYTFDLEDGDHTVEVRAWDHAGNNNTDIVNFTVDTTPPEVNITTPKEDEIFDVDEVMVEWTGSDENSGIDHYEIRINDEEWIDKGNDTEHIFSDLDDGEHTVEVRTWDNAGNNEIDSVNFIVDTTPPEIEITTPEKDEIFETDEITVEWTGSDEISGISHYEIRINDEEWIDKGTETNHTFMDLEVGEHTVEVLAVDRAENSASDSVEFEVSLEPDILAQNLTVEPTKGEVPLEVNITGELKNEGTAEGEISLFIDGEEIDAWNVQSEKTKEINTTYKFEEIGMYEVMLGNETVEVTVEKEHTIVIGPLIDQNGDPVDDAQVTLSWADREPMEMDQGSAGYYNFTVSLTTPAEMTEFTYTVEHDDLKEDTKARDFSGTESGEMMLDLEREDPDDTEEEIFYRDYWWIILVLVLVAIGVIIALVMKKNRKPEERSEKEEIHEENREIQEKDTTTSLESEDIPAHADENGVIPPPGEAKKEEAETDKMQTENPDSEGEPPQSIEEPPPPEGKKKEKEDDGDMPSEEKEILSLLEEDDD